MTKRELRSLIQEEVRRVMRLKEASYLPDPSNPKSTGSKDVKHLEKFASFARQLAHQWFEEYVYEILEDQEPGISGEPLDEIPSAYISNMLKNLRRNMDVAVRQFLTGNTKVVDTFSAYNMPGKIAASRKLRKEGNVGGRNGTLAGLVDWLEDDMIEKEIEILDNIANEYGEDAIYEPITNRGDLQKFLKPFYKEISDGIKWFIQNTRD